MCGFQDNRFNPSRCENVPKILIWRLHDEDEIAYFTVCWKTRASFVYRNKNMR